MGSFGAVSHDDGERRNPHPDACRRCFCDGATRRAGKKSHKTRTSPIHILFSKKDATRSRERPSARVTRLRERVCNALRPLCPRACLTGRSHAAAHRPRGERGGAGARRAPVKPTQFFRGRFDGKQFRTEPLEAATFDEFSTDEGAAPGPRGQLFTADGAPLMTAPCCIKARRPRLIHAVAAQPRENTTPARGRRLRGGGGNAVNRMVETDAGSFVDFWAMNTDAQALSRSLAGNTMNIGAETTRGLGAGGTPTSGRRRPKKAERRSPPPCRARTWSS